MYRMTHQQGVSIEKCGVKKSQICEITGEVDTFSKMKSKRCSHNLQSDHQGSCQRISVHVMRITSYTTNAKIGF